MERIDAPSLQRTPHRSLRAPKSTGRQGIGTHCQSNVQDGGYEHGSRSQVYFPHRAPFMPSFVASTLGLGADRRKGREAQVACSVARDREEGKRKSQMRHAQCGRSPMGAAPSRASKIPPGPPASAQAATPRSARSRARACSCARRSKETSHG